jgi:hypothetical protein
MLGVGVAAGDIVAVAIRRVRRRVVEPAVQTVVIAPLGQLGGVLGRDRGRDEDGPGVTREP